MIETISTNKSKLSIDTENGGKILLLELTSAKTKNKRKVIESNHDNFFLSGSFLMYPWVNRLSSNNWSYKKNSYYIEPKLSDENNHPIHGLFYNSARKLIYKEESSSLSKISIVPEKYNSLFPEFIEHFILSDNSLEINFEVLNKTNLIQYFSIGYHPYLSLNTPIDKLKIITNLKYSIPLTEELIPFASFTRVPIETILSDNLENIKLDHCLKGDDDSYFGILDNSTGESILCRSLIDSIKLSYYQIYTPPDRKSIAIEPMSSCGDVFLNSNSKPISLRPSETKKASFKIEFS